MQHLNVYISITSTRPIYSSDATVSPVSTKNTGVALQPGGIENKPSFMNGEFISKATCCAILT